MMAPSERKIYLNDHRWTDAAVAMKRRGFDGPPSLFQEIVGECSRTLFRQYDVAKLKLSEFEALLRHIDQGDFDKRIRDAAQNFDLASASSSA